ncbi:MAG: hypothetical protein KAT85_10525 [candidate division Zixibacteria bacterium]|nr:hypothetical protein [candidate division Zixibacteria bacterium]
MNSYYYDFRDIFRAPRIALHGKNIFLQMTNMLTGYIGYGILAYVALIADGVDMSYAWEVHFLFPVGTLGLVSILGKLIWAIGVLWFLFWLLRGNIAVSKTSFEEIRGNIFFSSSEARTFVKEKKGILYRAFLGVIGFIVFLVILGLIAGLIGKIPVVGEISFGLFYGFPYYIISLFAVLVLFLCVTFFLTGPTVVGIKGEDTLTALFDGFSTITSRPLRWGIYTAASVVIAKVCSFVLFYFSFRAFQFINGTSGVFMGDKGKILFESACDKFPMGSATVKFLSYLYPGSDFGINMYLLGAFHPADTLHLISTYLLVISIGLVFTFIIAYFINTIVVSQVIAFIDIRRQTHDELLAELPEDEMWDDFEIKEKKGEATSEDKPEDAQN